MEVNVLLKEYISDTNLVDDVKILLFDFVDYKAQEGFPFARLVHLFYDTFGGSKKEIEMIAVGMECLVLALDIFDDLEDGDNTNPIWTKIPKNIVLNAASCLQMLSYQIIEESRFEVEKVIKAKEIYNKCFMAAISGQHMEMTNKIKNEDDYIQNTRRKSGSLLSLACQLGTVFASEENLEEVQVFGELLGIRAQIDNDIKDVLSNREKNDLLHKKITLPVLYLMNQRQESFPLIQQYYQGLLEKETFQQSLSEMLPHIQKSGAIEYARVIGHIKEQEAKQLVNNMNLDNDRKMTLLSLFPK